MTSTGLERLKAFWRDIWTPSRPDETLRDWAATAATHACIGAAGAWPFAPTVWVALAVGGAYLVFKEGFDLRRKGSLADSLVDAGFVALGAAAGIVPAYPVVLIGLVTLGILLRALIA